MKKVWKKVVTSLLCAAVCVAPTVAPRVMRATAASGPELLRSYTFDSDSDSAYTRHGGEVVAGADGSKAIRLKNDKTAENYIDLGEIDLGADTFTITMDIKIPLEQVIGGAYCAILGTQDWGSYANPGFMIATGKDGGDFFGVYTSISSEANSKLSKPKSYYARNLTNTDGLWHSMAVVFNRSAKVQYWVDGVHYTERDLDISSMGGETLGKGHLYAGCDGAKKNPAIDTTLDNIKIYKGRLTKSQIVENAGHIMIANEIANLEHIYALRKTTGVTYEGATACEAAIQAGYAALTSAKTAADINAAVDALRAAQKAVDVTQTPNMKFLVFSDCHIDGGSGAGYPEVEIAKGFFTRMLSAIKDDYGDADALLVPGDFTKNGKEIDYQAFVSLYRAYNPEIENVMITLGNHEMFQGTKPAADARKTYAELREWYLNYTNQPDLGFVEHTEVYFDKWVNGYHFINLAIDGPKADGTVEDNFAILGEEQLAWLEEKLAENAQAGKPIFVTCHEPLKYTSPLSYKYSIGEQDEQVKAIFEKYPQVVFMSGHLHDGFLGAAAVTQNEWGVQYDIPSSWQNSLANQDASFVTCFKVFDDRTEIEAYNYEERRVMHGSTHIVWHDTLNAQAGGKVIENATVSIGSQAADAMTDNETTLVRYHSGFSLAAREGLSLTVTLPEAQAVSALRVYAENVTAYDVEYSVDGTNWKAPANSRGVWSAEAGWKSATFGQVTAKYVRLIPVSGRVEDDAFAVYFGEVIALQ